MAKQARAQADGIEAKNRRTALLIGVVLVVIVGVLVWRFLFTGRDRYEVSGTVLRAGQPIDMENCRIIFTNRETQRLGVGILDKLGQYRIYTYKDSGLPPGEYDVVVSFPAEYLVPLKSNGESYSHTELEKILARTIPRRYRKAETSGEVLRIIDEDVVFNVDMTD